MKLKIKENAYFNETYYKAGQVVDLIIDEVPSWAELIEAPKTQQKQEDKGEAQEQAKKQYLEELLNEAFEKEIFIEDADKKTVAEQIEELEELLKKGE